MPVPAVEQAEVPGKAGGAPEASDPLEVGDKRLAARRSIYGKPQPLLNFPGFLSRKR
ncbi:hypothetical protein HMSSN036_56090 [Paenibacillus macerans]|nr:hypothetical protein HMSSN036_56090 [Paenibacillus macerans]